jgi:hypothetical protein
VNQPNDPRLASVNQPYHKPLATWSEVLPNLWQGGTEDDDIYFDSVYTLYGWANPVGWFVKETRLGFHDSDSLTVHPKQLYDLASQAHRDWKEDKRVLIRCQAGLNRSALITALVLIKEGFTASQAITLLRETRSEYVLINPHFEKWLLETEHFSEL